jgi:hypothetical protein
MTLEIPPPPKTCPRCGSIVNAYTSITGVASRETAVCAWRHELRFDRDREIWYVRG